MSCSSCSYEKHGLTEVQNIDSQLSNFMEKLTPKVFLSFLSFFSLFTLWIQVNAWSLIDICSESGWCYILNTNHIILLGLLLCFCAFSIIWALQWSTVSFWFLGSFKETSWRHCRFQLLKEFSLKTPTQLKISKIKHNGAKSWILILWNLIWKQIYSGH